MKSILVVDDEQDIVSLLTDYLLSLGFHCVSAKNGAEAIKHISNEKFDLIISDFSMPGGDGLDIMQFLNDYKKAIPVIWLTGNADGHHHKRAWDLGLTEFIQKPVRLTVLKEAIDTALALGPDYVKNRQK